MRFWKLLLASLLLGLFLAGCQSYPGTGSLWIGMSRSQALRAMGPPESVSAQGAFEYMNYTLPVNAGGYVSSRPYYVRLQDDVVESFGYSGQFAPGARPAAAPPRVGTAVPMRKESIRVLSVEPSTVQLDRPNKLKVKLAFATTQAAAIIHLSFNTKTPDMYLTLAKQAVVQGAGELEVVVNISPVTWANRTDVQMIASLYPSPTPSGTSSLDSMHFDLAVAR